MHHRATTLVLPVLLLTLLLLPVPARAAPSSQTDPAAQCAEGMQLLQERKAAEAQPLLEAGFAGREGATFAKPDDLGICALVLGRLRDDTGDRRGALEAYTVALDIFHSSGSRTFEGATLNNIGTVYSKQGQYDRALESHQQALAILRDVGDRAAEGITLSNIGTVYSKQGQYDRALESYQQALAILREVGDQAHEGATLNGIGLVYYNQGQYDRALESYQQALAISREVGDQAQEGATLSNIGTVYSKQERYDRALESHQQALVIERELGNRAGEGTTLNNIGQVYHNQGRYAEALESYQQALAIRRELGDRASEGTTLNNISLVYRQQGRHAEALESYQQALAIRRELGDRAGEGTTLNNIGLVYRHLGRYTEALKAYQQALEVYHSSGNRKFEGTILNNIGGVYKDQGRYDTALKAYQQALAIAREVGDRAGESTTLNNIGLVYRHLGRYAQALEAYQQALAIAREVGDRAGEGTTLLNIGTVYGEQGRSTEALEVLQQVLAIEREVRDRADEGTTLSNIGGVYSHLGRYAQALEAYQQALAIVREVGDRAGEGAVLNNIGEVYRQQGRSARSLEVLQQALAIVREVGDRAGEGTTLSNIGLVYHQQGRSARALESYQQALAIVREVGDRAGEGVTLSNIGFAYEHQGDAMQALAHYTQGMDVLEAVRAEAGSEQGRAGFIAQYANLYEQAALLAHQQHQDDLAFVASERGRARAFLDSLATGAVQLSDQQSATLWSQEHEAYTARQATQEALAKARAANPPDAALVANLEQQLQDAERKVNAARDAIASRGDQLAALVPGRTSGVLGVAQVQKLLAAQTTLVSFFVGVEQTLAFIISHDRFQTIVLPIGQSALREQVRALLDSPAFQQQAHPPESVALYTTLFAPLKPYLTTSHLAIVPNGPLHYLPFAALTDGQRYLADEYVLSVLPSASALRFIQTNTGHPPAPPLILGNPDGTLRFAEREAQAVATLYGVQPLLEQQASEAELRARVAQAGILHLAAHGRYDPAVPLASLLALAPGAEQQPEADGRLEAGEVYSLDLKNSDLVVLSACQTSLGDVSAGDEVVGLTRAFFFAGTPTVVSSLWSVDDEATGLLMERFYTHLRAGMGKAAALRQAQLDVRAQFPAPYYWAGFVLAGDAGTLPSEAGWRWVTLGGVLALVMVGLAGALVWLHHRLILDWSA